MLKELTVTDFAIVKYASVQFEAGFNVLTGETGAGKSILIGAAEVALGGRPSDEMIRAGAKRAVVEARFGVKKGDEATSWLDEAGFDLDDEEVIVRRIIERDGKNRAYINGAMATVGQIRALGGMLVDIHGQHETQALFHPSRHLPLFDRFVGIGKEVDEYRRVYQECRAEQKKLFDIKENRRAIEQRLDLLRHQSGEIDEASLDLNEEETLKNEKAILVYAQKLLTLGAEVISALEGEGGSAGMRVSEAKGALVKMTEIDPSLAQALESISSALIQIEETSAEIGRYASSVTSDHKRLEEVDDRLDLIRSLKKKYGETIADILAFARTARAELESIEQDQEGEERLEAEVERLAVAASDKALAIDVIRHESAARFESATQKELKELAMEKATMVCAFSYEDDPKSHCLKEGRAVKLGDSGIGRMEILISANPGEEPKPVSRIASGGEISRIMLAIKTVLADRQPAKVMIFDEIDSGIGGVTADRVGEKLAGLAKRSQVFCVTHLAQVASQATAHYTVTKKADKTGTEVEIAKLDREDRILELARMAGGERAPEAAAKWAEKALGSLGA